MQTRDGIGTHVAPLQRITAPMHVADHPARRVCLAARHDRVGLRRRDLGENQRPRGADRAVSRRIRSVHLEIVAVGGTAHRRVVHHEWTRALVLLLCRRGGTARIGQRSAQQHIKVRRIRLRDLCIERAGERVRGVRKRQVRVGDRQRPGRCVAKLERLAAVRFVHAHFERTGRRRRRHQREAVGKSPPPSDSRPGIRDGFPARRPAYRCARHTPPRRAPT